MPIIDHSKAPEVPWRPGYRKWDVTGREQGVTSTFSLNTDGNLIARKCKA